MAAHVATDVNFVKPNVGGKNKRARKYSRRKRISFAPTFADLSRTSLFESPLLTIEGRAVKTRTSAGSLFFS